MFPTAFQTIVWGSDGWDWVSTLWLPGNGKVRFVSAAISATTDILKRSQARLLMTAGTQSISNLARYRHFVNAFKSLSLASVINKAGWTAQRGSRYGLSWYVFWAMDDGSMMIIRRQLWWCRKFLWCTEVWPELLGHGVMGSWGQGVMGMVVPSSAGSISQ